MRRVVLISCASKKLETKATAAELYVSNLFKLGLQYANALEPDAIFVLSAKHGLLALDDEIEPYDVTLNTMPSSARRSWAIKVITQLRERFDLGQDHFIILAGKRYREYLVPHFSSYEVPLRGLPIGKQLRFLKEHV